MDSVVLPILVTCLFHVSLKDLTALRNEVTAINSDVPSYEITLLTYSYQVEIKIRSMC
jgi:hypothetical protein